VYLIYFNVLKSRALLLFSLTLLSVQGFAQDNPKIDSLNRELSRSESIDRFNILYELTFEYIGAGDFQKALRQIDEAQEIAQDRRDSLRIVKAGRVKGQVLRRLDQTDDAIQEFLKVLPVSKRNNFITEYKYILNGLAVTYTLQANYTKALQYHFESLVLREKEHDHLEVGIVLNNIGLVYFKLKNYEKALEYYKRSLEQTPNGKYNDQYLINIGLCYNQLNDFVSAKKYIDEGIKFCSPNCNDLTSSIAEYGLGVALFRLNLIEESREHFVRAIALARKRNDRGQQIEDLIFLAKISNQQGQLDQVMQFMKEAETLISGTNYNELQVLIYEQYGALFLKKKDYAKASEYLGKYIKLKDSVYSQDLIKNLANVQTEYEERENIKTIKDKDTALALQEEILKRQRAENLFYVVVSVMVFVLAGLMLLLFNLTRRANERLEERVDARTKEINDTNDALTKVNGEMDNFIYKTSHDIRGPLASLKGICNVAIMDVKDEIAMGYLKKLDTTAEKLNTILTRLLIINQINHAVLAANVINFEEIIEEILFLERKKGVPKRLNISYEIKKGFEIKSDKEMLRIVMENLIDNSIKFHNESERVEPFAKINVYPDADSVVIKVTDNGVGINDETKEKIFQMFVRASERSETGGIGLYLSKLATGRLEGTIDFTTTPEKYTEFTVRLPRDLGPILDHRKEQEKIREFERFQQIEKQKIISPS
jgi:signal transduction histidine kinase